MPTIFFYGPELDREKKRELVRSLTEAASKSTGIDKPHFSVYLRATSRDSVAIGGELLSDREERIRNRK